MRTVGLVVFIVLFVMLELWKGTSNVGVKGMFALRNILRFLLIVAVSALVAFVVYALRRY